MSPSDYKMSNNDIFYQIGPAVHQVCAPEWSWSCPDASVFNGFLIWLVEGGEAELKSKHGQFTVRRGDFLLMSGSQQDFYYGRHDPRQPLDVSWMHLRPAEPGLLTIPGNLLDRIGFFQTLRDPLFAATLLRRLLDAAEKDKPFWLSALLREVEYQICQSADRPLSPNELIIESLCRKITENPSRYRKIADLPSIHACSRDHLIRLFKKHRGITPGEFIIRARIDHAKQLLQLPGMSVKQAALDLGYPDPYAFSKQFKVRTGMPPGKFQALKAGQS